MRCILGLGLVLATAQSVRSQSAQPSEIRGSTSTPTAASDPAIDAGELEVLNLLHTSNLVEIAAGRLAQSRARNVTIKRFGNTLVTDHTRADAELMTVAKQLHLTLRNPSGHELDELKRPRSSANFDREFLNMMAHDHEETLRQVQEAKPNLQTPAVQALVEKTLPLLQKHQDDAIRQLQNSPF
jgi:putative membrane protein